VRGVSRTIEQEKQELQRLRFSGVWVVDTGLDAVVADGAQEHGIELLECVATMANL
jgi:hypothetical protein